MSLLYSCVAYRATILAHASRNPQIANQFAQDLPPILGQIDASKPGRSASCKQGMDFYCYVTDGITFICFSDPGVSKNVAFGFLSDLASTFSTRYGLSSVKFATAYQMNSDFAPVMANIMAGAAANGSKTQQVKEELAEVKGLVMDNVQRVMERAQRLNQIADKSDDLKTSAIEFDATSKRLRNQMRKKKIMMIVGITAAVIILLLIIILPIVL